MTCLARGTQRRGSRAAPCKSPSQYLIIVFDFPIIIGIVCRFVAALAGRRVLDPPLIEQGLIPITVGIVGELTPRERINAVAVEEAVEIQDCAADLS